jgi:hypothetical protein
MSQEIATSIVTFGSFLLFVFWFRYVCLLVLRARPARDYAHAAAAANQLSFPDVQALLHQRASADLEELRRMLDRDFALLTYVLAHVASPPAGVAALEKRILEIDYRLLRAWCGVSAHFSRSAACRALAEMSTVVAHFANSLGERGAGVAVPT